MNIKIFLFIASTFRSGGALTTRMLNAHSQIGMTADKLKFFLFCYERNVPLNKEKLREILEEVSSRLETRFKIDINCQTCLDELTCHPLTWHSL